MATAKHLKIDATEVETQYAQRSKYASNVNVGTSSSGYLTTVSTNAAGDQKLNVTPISSADVSYAVSSVHLNGLMGDVTIATSTKGSNGHAFGIYQDNIKFVIGAAIVTLRGETTFTDGETICTLPTDFAPGYPSSSTLTYRDSYDDLSTEAVRINTSGAVVASSGFTTSRDDDQMVSIPLILKL